MARRIVWRDADRSRPHELGVGVEQRSQRRSVAGDHRFDRCFEAIDRRPVLADGGDEINIVEKGRNYGFPAIGYGREYSGKPINGDKTAQQGMEQPVYFWTPDIAPAGIAFYSGKRFPAWQDNLFVSTLVGRALVRLVLNGDRVAGEERLLTDLNARIRGVEEGPDGALYVLTDGPAGKILRLVPKP